MKQDGLNEAQERHNAYAPSLAAMVIAAGHDKAPEALIILESVVVGVIERYFSENRQGAIETLDLITAGALRRLR